MSSVAREKTLRGLCPQRTWTKVVFPRWLPFIILNSNDTIPVLLVVVEQSNIIDKDALASLMRSIVQPQNPTNWLRHVRYIDSTYYNASESDLPAIKQQMQESNLLRNHRIQSVPTLWSVWHQINPTLHCLQDKELLQTWRARSSTT